MAASTQTSRLISLSFEDGIRMGPSVKIVPSGLNSRPFSGVNHFTLFAGRGLNGHNPAAGIPARMARHAPPRSIMIVFRGTITGFRRRRLPVQLLVSRYYTTEN